MSEILLFPIRHHSPACAWHVARLIAERRPRTVLIEGPQDATALVPLLADQAARAPLAIYTTWADTTNLLGRPAAVKGHPARFAAYYPLADYSPELVALRQSLATGATVAFIDLTFPQMVLAERGTHDERTRSLLDERHLRHSRYLHALCERTGARDPDDLWDHLFEADFHDLPTDEFLRRVSTYCDLARADYSNAMLAAEGHHAREAAMAAAIAAEAAKGDGTILVVTGGFHTAGLRELLGIGVQGSGIGDRGSGFRVQGSGGEGQGARGTGQGSGNPIPEPRSPIPGDAQTLLVRYGFPQLDRLNGYASGMPAPEFYQRVWEAAQGDEAERGRVAAGFIVELGRGWRKRNQGLSVADAIAALEATRRLAHFRGHARPTREDLLDGVRTALVKGDADAEGALLLAEAQRLLAGERVGELPPGVGEPALVRDFRAEAARHRLNLADLTRRELALDLYRNAGHRAASRFFHRLAYLGVPFAQHRAGPDFVTGHGLERLYEHWNYAWTPGTESALVERSLYGATLEEACAARLAEELEEDALQGVGRRADRAAAHLLVACRMGLHRFTPELLARTAMLIGEDASLPSLVATAEQLLLLHLSREPLEAHQLPGLRDEALAAYRRACYLLPELALVPEGEESAALAALNTLQQVALSLEAGLADETVAALRELRRGGLRTITTATTGVAALRGGAAGALFADGALAEEELVGLARSHLAAAAPATAGGTAGPPPAPGPAFLRGLLRTCRSCLWQLPVLLAALDEAVGGFDEARFVRLLPELRLAFADLSARETSIVAQALAERHGTHDLPGLRLSGINEAELLTGVALNARVNEALARDGLMDFMNQ